MKRKEKYILFGGAMYFRNREYTDESLFKTRLRRLMDQKGIKSARELARSLFENELVYIKPMNEDSEEWKFKQDRIGAIEKKIQAHLNADTVNKVSGEYINAYSKLFNCSPDYLFGRTVIEVDDIGIRRFCEVTNLSEKAVIRLVESKNSYKGFQSAVWSNILSSSLYYSIPEDCSLIQIELNTCCEKNAELALRKWEKDNVRNEEEVDLEYMIENLEEQARSSLASVYGILAKISRQVENYLESELLDGFDEYKKQRTQMLINMSKRFYEKEDMLLAADSANKKNDSCEVTSENDMRLKKL